MAQYEEWQFHINDVDAFIWWYKDDGIPSLEDMRLFYEVGFLTEAQIADGVYYTFLSTEEYKYITGKDYAGKEPIKPRPLPQQPAPPVTDWEGPLVQPSPDDAPSEDETPQEPVEETPVEEQPEEPEADIPAEEAAPEDVPAEEQPADEEPATPIEEEQPTEEATDPVEEPAEDVPTEEEDPAADESAPEEETNQ